VRQVVYFQEFGVISFFICLRNVWDVAVLLEVFAPIFQNWNNNDFVLQLSSMWL